MPPLPRLPASRVLPELQKGSGPQSSGSAQLAGSPAGWQPSQQWHGGKLQRKQRIRLPGLEPTLRWGWVAVTGQSSVAAAQQHEVSSHCPHALLGCVEFGCWLPPLGSPGSSCGWQEPEAPKPPEEARRLWVHSTGLGTAQGRQGGWDAHSHHIGLVVKGSLVPVPTPPRLTAPAGKSQRWSPGAHSEQRSGNMVGGEVFGQDFPPPLGCE